MEERKEKFRGKQTERKKDDEFGKTLVAIRRVTKVVKGGRTMRFSALVVVGDKNGSVGIGTGKAGEVPDAVEKATEVAKKNMKKINIINGTIPHDAIGKFSSTSILLFPAKKGTGIVAGGSARAVIELSGIKDLVTKIHGSTNKINTVKATMKGLLSVKTREEIAAKRGKLPEEI